jgi:hypothetical protein
VRSRTKVQKLGNRERRIFVTISDFEDNEARYALNPHSIFNRPEYEQVNTANEIINAIHETNANSLSALLINEHEESRFWNISAWATKLQVSLITICAIVLGGDHLDTIVEIQVSP